MIEVFTDPYCLACPSSDTNIEEIEEYIDFIIGFEEITDAWWIKRYFPSATFDILASANGYPDWDLLKDAINRLGHVAQPQDVIKIVEKALQMHLFLEDKLQINDVLFDKLHCDPEFYKSREEQCYVEATKKMLVMICFYNMLNAIEQPIVISRDFKQNLEVITAFAEIAACDFSDNFQEYDIPYQINHNIIGCRNIIPLFTYVDPIELWKVASKESEYVDVINIKITQTGNNVDRSQYCLGKDFIASAKQFDFLKQTNRITALLRSMTEAILNLNMKTTHQLRIGCGGNDPQVIRIKDNAKAWRRDIDYEYHLHYWETRRGKEFAEVVIHKDMTISN